MTEISQEEQAAAEAKAKAAVEEACLMHLVIVHVSQSQVGGILKYICIRKQLDKRKLHDKQPSSLRSGHKMKQKKTRSHAKKKRRRRRRRKTEKTTTTTTMTTRRRSDHPGNTCAERFRMGLFSCSFACLAADQNHVRSRGHHQSRGLHPRRGLAQNRGGVAVQTAAGMSCMN